MQIGRIEGATRTLGKSQGYLGLPLRDETISCTVNGPDTPAMVTAWHPTPDELARLNAGAAVHVRILGSAHPPMMVEVGEMPTEEKTSPILGPITAEQFMALPIRSVMEDDAVAYFVSDDLIVSCVDEDGQGWMLGRLKNGHWFRRRA